MNRIIAIVALVGLGLSTAVFVDSGDKAVVYRFGEINRSLSSGLGFRAPWPIESHQIVDVSEVRRAEPGRVRMLTGDTNLVDLDLVIQYNVSDPVAYQLGLADGEATLTSIVLSVTKDMVGTMTVDTLLTTGRTELQLGAAKSAQALLDRYRSGLRVDAVEVREITPPPAVLEAFKDVSSARGDRETLALAAEAYASKRLPEVRGEASQTLESAKAFRAERGAQANGDVARFQTLLNAKRASPASTRSQLWLETAQRVGEIVNVEPLRSRTEIRLQAAPYGDQGR
jgi:membrane protease subunit HflK